MIERHRSMRWCIVAGMLLCSLAGCSKQSGSDRSRPAMSERRRDSMIAASPLPGAGAVGKALAASDSTAARAARIDSLTRQTRVR